MANPLKRLAGETVIYGMSTILARMINFFFVPIYTRILSQEGYGAYSEIMSYIAVLQVALTLGLETGCFRFANKQIEDFAAKRGNSEGGCGGAGGDAGAGSGAGAAGGAELHREEEKPFSNALVTVLGVSLVAFLAIALFNGKIASLMGYEGYGVMILYVGGIMLLDAVTAILFARLRYYRKAFKFALFKSIKIVSELGFNLLLFFGAPAYLASHPDSLLLNFIPAQADFSYIIFAVLLSCILCALLFLPDLLRMHITFSPKLWRNMMLYSLPIMIAGLPGIVNESLDRILFRFYAPDSLSWRAELGVYQAAVKLAVIMNLFIQMFRYAAEPFFFARNRERGSGELYAKVMEYFVAFCMLIFLGVTLYIDLIGLILGKDFRGAMATVPFMLISYMLLGVLFNVSMWYKLSGQTKYAINITLSGLAVTAVVNILLMPLFSYWASVAAHLLSVLAMLIYSTYLGNKYYPIPYRWRRIGTNIAAGVAIMLLGMGADALMEILAGRKILALELGVNTLFIAAYMLFCYLYNFKKNKAYN